MPLQMGDVVSFRQSRISEETLTLLERLTDAARSGDLTGIALVALYTDHRYAGFLAGESKDSPTFTRGALRKLEDKLSDIVDRTP